MTAELIITPEIATAIEGAIRNAELGTSGEIRVHIDDRCNEDILDRAAFLFSELAMHKTELRNGVLILVTTDDRKMAILGDGGIHSKVGQDFWDDAKSAMISHFKNNNWKDGLCEGVRLVGEKLKMHFPIAANDTNELSNTITFGKNTHK
jgi:uncharacterized membrane protein